MSTRGTHWLVTTLDASVSASPKKRSKTCLISSWSGLVALFHPDWRLVAHFWFLSGLVRFGAVAPCTTN